MLRFAVCDDSPTELKALKSLIHRYTAEKGVKIAAEYYSDRRQIVNLLPHADDYDCLFLDIYMEELNGIDLARHIRKHGAHSNIIFFTTSKDHALDAYGVNALQYLLKPVQYEDLINAIELIKNQKRKQDPFICITRGADNVRIALADFVYSEAQKHYQYIYLKNREAEKTRISCTELFELLNSYPEFVRCGASFILNLKFIERITATDVYLLDGRRVPIPRRSSSELKEKYDKYFFTGGGASC